MDKKSLGLKYSAKAKELYSWLYLDKPEFEKLLKKYSKPNAKLLDLGCGDGRVFEIYTKFKVKEENITGLDWDVKLLKIAQQKYPKVKCKKINLRNLKKTDFKEKSDLIFSIHVLHYFSEKELTKIFFVCRNLLKSQGKLIFLVTHPVRWVQDDLSEYFSHEKKLIPTSWGTKMKIYLNNFEVYSKSLEKASFLIKSIKEPIPIKKGRFDEENYEKYLNCPSRLWIVAEKL